MEKDGVNILAERKKREVEQKALQEILKILMPFDNEIRGRIVRAAEIFYEIEIRVEIGK